MKKHIYGTFHSRSGFALMLHSLIRRYFIDGVGRSAAALAYYLIFSFFPFLIFINTLLGFLDLPVLTANSFEDLIPSDIISLINTYLSHVSEVKNGYTLFFGLFFTLFFIMRAMDCLMRSISRAYRLTESKDFPFQQIRVFLSTIFLMITISFSLVLMTFGRRLLTFLSRFIPLDPGSIRAWNILRFFILALLLFAMLSLLYYLVPNSRFRFREILPGTFSALVSWLLFSIGFAYYVENMANYSLLYGSIGAVIILLLWLYLSATVLIMGAELNSVFHDRKRQKKVIFVKKGAQSKSKTAQPQNLHGNSSERDSHLSITTVEDRKGNHD